MAGLDPLQRLERLLGSADASGRRVAVLGMGNPLLGDDGIGTRIAEDVAALGRADRVGIPVGIALENGYGLVRRSGAGLLLLVDAVVLEELPPGAWDLFPPEGLDTAIHSTHSVPLPLFVRMWKEDLPGLEVAFLGISIRGAVMGQDLSEAAQAARQGILGALRGRGPEG